MNEAPIPVNTPLLDGNEKLYLLECISDGWISSEGPFVSRFEAEFARVVGRKYAIACANGSAALDIAVAALGLADGDEVIMPSFTIISPAASVVRAGAIPVFVDCDAATWNMDVSLIEGKLSAKTKAILVVHIYGLPTDMKPIQELASKYGLAILEDAAEMHGQTCYGQPCGSFGELSTFSFYPNKHITTGEGGMVVTDDEKLAEECRSFRNLCFEPQRRFVHRRLGWNYRMTNLQAALGLAQLEKLDEHVQRKREIGRLYDSLLSGIPELQIPLQRTEYAENIYWVFGLVANENCAIQADQLSEKLNKMGIGTRPFFWPMHEQPVFSDEPWNHDRCFPVAERIARRGFYVPSGLGLQDTEIVRVAEAIREILRPLG